VKNTPVFHYPLFLNLKDRPVIVIGGGAVATRKILTLLQSEANLTVISPQLTPELLKLEQQGQIKIRQRSYQYGDLQDAFLAFTATNKAEVNQAVADEAKKAQILINVADRSSAGDFIVPAIFSEQTFTVAVSTQGKTPTLAVSIRDKIKTLLTQKS